MLLNVTSTAAPATDLGFLLHKHPDRVQRFSLPFGAAHVFYPEASDERCTASLLLDVDPVGLVRRGNHGGFALAEYVNDRPYVASSFLFARRSDSPVSGTNSRPPGSSSTVSSCRGRRRLAA